jgi:hypothetical protein
MKLLPLLMICLFLSSCTYNISMAHTEGTASDTIDDNATPTATPTITTNVSAIPGV